MRDVLMYSLYSKRFILSNFLPTENLKKHIIPINQYVMGVDGYDDKRSSHSLY